MPTVLCVHHRTVGILVYLLRGKDFLTSLPRDIFEHVDELLVLRNLIDIGR